MTLSHHAMPLMVFNLAGEMLYILNQRLQAQNLEKVSHRHSFGTSATTVPHGDGKCSRLLSLFSSL